MNGTSPVKAKKQSSNAVMILKHTRVGFGIVMFPTSTQKIHHWDNGEV